MDKSLKIALGSLGVSLVVLAIKFTAYLIAGSLALYSDALESIINVATSIAAIFAVTSLGVLVGVVLTVLTGIAVLDACIAVLVALHVLWSGYRILRENARGPMDEAVPAEELERIRAAISTDATDAIEAHALRTRHAGKATFIDFDLVVSGTMSVSQAHEICDRLETAIKKMLAGAVITIHVEPNTRRSIVEFWSYDGFAGCRVDE